MRFQHRRELRERGFVILGLDFGADRGEIGRLAEVTLSTASASVAASDTPTSNAERKSAGLFMVSPF
jgi:hypothetical protein